MAQFRVEKDNIEEFTKWYEDVRTQLSCSDDKVKLMLPSTFVGKGRKWLMLRIDNNNLNAITYKKCKEAIIESLTKSNPRVDCRQIIRDRIGYKLIS